MTLSIRPLAVVLICSISIWVLLNDGVPKTSHHRGVHRVQQIDAFPLWTFSVGTYRQRYSKRTNSTSGCSATLRLRSLREVLAPISMRVTAHPGATMVGGGARINITWKNGLWSNACVGCSSLTRYSKGSPGGPAPAGPCCAPAQQLTKGEIARQIGAQRQHVLK